jgi:hypothetical protein
MCMPSAHLRVLPTYTACLSRIHRPRPAARGLSPYAVASLGEFLDHLQYIQQLHPYVRTYVHDTTIPTVTYRDSLCHPTVN